MFSFNGGLFITLRKRRLFVTFTHITKINEKEIPQFLNSVITHDNSLVQLSIVVFLCSLVSS